MRLALGLLVASSIVVPSALADAPAPAPELARVLHEASQGQGLPATLPNGLTIQAALVEVSPPVAAAATPVPPPKPDLAPPAPVPAERSEATPRITLSPNTWSTAISEPPVIEDESAASAELLQWRDHLAGKKDRRIERGAEIGGLAAMGVRLGSRAQAGSITGATDEMLASLQSWNEEGALVISVVAGSPAEQAGLQPGDVIVQFGGIWIDSTSLLVRVASRAQVEREIDVWVLRGGEIERLWLAPVDRRDLETR